ncbi:DUF402 domain-containing protein [Paenibacillus alkalitolerans]|uniref:DUF402 domain-containing protein n=1 Tax=Paenibacillus alkalitolerans TaxID=2799335 RepID=UPI001F1DCADA|nr:DUF402 domain-containing protein [Paenibacillus alkalitolerans]
MIKSFKHDGHLHRMWYENWPVPRSELHPDHQEQGMKVLINHGTRIREADGKEWVSRIPGVTYFIPGQWFNIVALLETAGVRYYCNIASPYYEYGNVITYIDYDLDVIKLSDGSINVVDEEEYLSHRVLYQYPNVVETKVRQGLERLVQWMKDSKPPFQDDEALRYYELWKNRQC